MFWFVPKVNHLLQTWCRLLPLVVLERFLECILLFTSRVRIHFISHVRTRTIWLSNKIKTLPMKANWQCRDDRAKFKFTPFSLEFLMLDGNGSSSKELSKNADMCGVNRSKASRFAGVLQGIFFYSNREIVFMQLSRFLVTCRST